ncbi:MAG: hypothetical protein NTZ61_15140 [Proteobacteria bacterium]|nr:hypothetical protein [Pseudomonadota bacterium]
MDPLSAIQRAIQSRRVRVAIAAGAVAIAVAAAHRLQSIASAPVATVATSAVVDPAQRAHLDELEQVLHEVAKQPPQAISPDGLRAVAERWTATQTDATRPFEPQHMEGAQAAVRDRNAPPRVPRTREERLRFAADIRSLLVLP